MKPFHFYLFLLFACCYSLKCCRRKTTVWQNIRSTKIHGTEPTP